jgi:hypothetical protein
VLISSICVLLNEIISEMSNDDISDVLTDMSTSDQYDQAEASGHEQWSEDTAQTNMHDTVETHSEKPEIEESTLRRSERQPKPSLKVRENCEAQFWEFIGTLSSGIEFSVERLQTEPSISVKMELERSLLKARDNLRHYYESLRQVFREGVPDAARIASDRCHEQLARLFERVKVDTTTHSSSSTHRSSTRTSSTRSSKKTILEAKAAALQVEFDAKHIETQQKLELASLQAREKARQAEFEAHERARQAEFEIEYERRRQEIETFKIQTELKKTQAEISALDQGSVVDGKDLLTKNFLLQMHDTVKMPVNKDQNTLPRQPETVSTPVDAATETVLQNLTKSFSESMNLSRLPAPEPYIFEGEPLKYPSWKAAFTALIDSRVISAREKIHYLRKYLCKEAKDSIEGLFYLDSDDAYTSAIKMLDERYGNPFLVAEGYRDKIENWPRIPASDGKALRRFADFLKQCLVAIFHCPSLEILSDCRENKKMLTKLPEWVVRKWRVRVTESIKNGNFPKFEEFVKFLTREAEIVCNPIVPVSNWKPLNTTERPRAPRRGPAVSALATSGTPNNQTAPVESQRDPRVVHQMEQTPARATVCVFCRRSNHTLDTCREFVKKTPAERSHFVKTNGLCFSCLVHGHLSRDCKSKHKCSKCDKRHPTCLCGDYEVLHPKESITGLIAGTSTSCRAETTVINQTSTSSMIVPVLISSTENPSEEIPIYALLDTQSDTTFILDETLEKLSTQSTPTKLKLTTMTNTSTVNSKRTNNLIVRSVHSPNKVLLPTVYSRESIPANLDHIPTKEATRRWPHLRHLTTKIPDKQDYKVGLLIGYDCPQALAPLEVVRGDGNQPYGVLTELGWSVVGKIHCVTETDDHLSHRVTTQLVPEDLQISQDNFVRSEVGFVCQSRVQDMSTPDILSILESDFSETRESETTVSQEDIKFMNILQDGVCQDSEGFYQLPLPFCTDNSPILPNSRRTAEKRLQHLKKRLKSNETYRTDYVQFMNGIIERGEAEEVPQEEIEVEKSWYIPHHGVYHPRKPSKIRVVFDCSAQNSGTSLNSVLLQGPDLLNSLVGVLCRFREKPIALVGDVEKMFHQFRVDPKDRDYLRFLWWKDGNLDVEPTVYRMKVHLFGAKSSPGCANYALKKLAADNKDKLTQAADFVTNNFYVDDGLGSFDTENDAVALVHDARQLCAEGNLRLHKFMSNSQVVMDSIPESERADEMIHDLFDQSPSGCVLGIEWLVDLDQFHFKLTIPAKPLTRRGVLSTVASIYDPLGFLAPFVLLGKQILQELCRSKCDWDEQLPEDLQPKWERWLSELHSLTQFKIQRCLLPKDFGEVKTQELHHFSDASFQGYGQCSYLRSISVTGRVHCSFVMGKARVAPLKAMTIPRLELTAATVSAKISNVLRSEMSCKEIQETFWTDSRIVLGYIHNDAKRFHVFVANRIQRIRDLSKPEQWRHVPGQDNPSDHASRGLYARELMDSNWLTGPDFLWRPELPMPDEVYETEVPPDDLERRRVVVHSTTTKKTKTVLEKLEYFSDWHRAVTAVTVLLKCICRKTGKDTGDVRRKAEIAVIRMMQQRDFQEEIEILQDQRKLHKGSRLISLDPFIDHEGILRVGGRVQRGPYSFEVKHPVILPKTGHFVELLIMRSHQTVCHQGRGSTMNELRARGYWILGCSRAVSSCIHRCVTCRRLRGQTLNQKMADLPKERLEATPPFTHCAQDCFGPFIVKEGRRELKRYGLIITCMASRAIHVELLDDMTTDAYINGLRCFIAIRGPVQTMRCDQGSNFVGADRELREALKEIKEEQLRKFFEKNQCRFIMNSPHSSHMGGCWERHIRTIRSILTTMLYQHSGRLDTSTLRTFLYESMAIVNSRPLTPQDLSDPQSVPLTPNHLIMMKSKVFLTPPGNFVREDVYTRKRWRRVQFLAQEFWRRWKREYLMTLQSRQKWHKEEVNVKKGDIVILKDDNAVRGDWRLGRVVDTIVDEDKLVRRVKLLMADSALSASGKRLTKPTVLERPIHKLTLLLEETE